MKAVQLLPIIALTLLVHHGAIGFSSLQKSDSWPLFSTHDPYLQLYKTNADNDKNGDEKKCKRVSFSVTPFRQSASKGNNQKKVETALTELDGPWGMIPLMYDDAYNPYAKASSTWTNTNAVTYIKSKLDTIKTDLSQSYSEVLMGTAATLGTGGAIDSFNTADYFTLLGPINQDPDLKFGFLAQETSFRKYGLRIECSVAPIKDICLFAKIGFVSAQHLKKTLTNLTTTADPNVSGSTAPTSTPGFPPSSSSKTFANAQTLVGDELVNKFDTIASELGLNVDSYEKNAIEDARVGIMLRHAQAVNLNEHDWGNFWFIPFAMFEAILPTSPTLDAHKVLGVPIGGNGHTGLSFEGGILLESFDGVALGIMGGITHFLDKTKQTMRLPNNSKQKALYPFYATDVTVNPGNNIHMGLSLHATHFFERANFYGQYLYVHHEQDKLTLANATEATHLLTAPVTKNSSWYTHLVNLGLNYELSKNANLGLAWQAPVKRKNAFKQTTLLISAEGAF